MNLEKVSEIISKQEIYIDNPAFYPLAFSHAAQQRKQEYARDGDNFRRVIAEEYNDLSRRLDLTRFQESCAVRNVLRTRRLANLLINDKGDLNVMVLPRLIDLLKKHFYSLGPNRQYDAKRQHHLLRVLTQLNENKELVRLLKSIDKPISHKYADQIIRDTLALPANTMVTEAHARRAVLAAWMCTLRQNVGSCFATAPAIIIHDERPEIFLKDVAELLNTGRLKRTFGGIEYSVPLSTSWGSGDLKKPFLLPLGEDFEKSRIWFSPGLIAAFESVGFVDPDDELEAKEEKVKALILEALSSLQREQPFIIITAEEIIRKALFVKMNLTEKDIQDYETRPQGMVLGGLLVKDALAVSSGGKGKLCSTFLSQFATACNALKALADNALLKAWEFSIASFAETKAQFTRWNLYSSLGLGSNEQGGIGPCLFAVIQAKLDQANRRVQEFQREYETVFHQLKTMESRMRSVSSEKEAAWVKAEYQSRRNEFYTLEDMRDEIQQKAQRLANSYEVLIDHYYELFPRYFQEVYDADMHDVVSGPYDDSPAGFRLLCKHGRSNTSQWSLIKTPNEFVDALASFFIATEPEISALKEFEGLQTDVSEMITSVVSHVRTKEFLETAFYRMAAAHRSPIIKDPLDNLDRIDKKPWAYTSGGTMATLVSCYNKLESPPTAVSKWMENPTELLVFVVDTLKQIPSKLMDEVVKNPNNSMLMHSPTHAFLLKPGLSLLKKAWTADAFTYTWVRDGWVNPRKKMLDILWLDEEKMHYLVQKLSLQVPHNYRHYFLRIFGNLYGNMRPKEFRDHIVDGMQRERGLKQGGNAVLSADEIDSALYSLLPLFPRSELREHLEKLYQEVPEIDAKGRQELMDVFDMVSQRYSQEKLIDADVFQDIAKGIICLTFEQTTSETDYHERIASAAQNLGYALLPPIVFADTNWVKEEFCFVVNPGTGELELWRGDATGRVGAPMSYWEQWLNGSRKDIPWGIYTKPYEYKGI